MNGSPRGVAVLTTSFMKREYVFFDRATLHNDAVSLFDIVMDIERYPDFLPACSTIFIKERDDAHMVADVSGMVGPISIAYTSYISFLKPHDTQLGWITVRATNKQFKYIRCDWHFIPQTTRETVVEFDLQFSCYSALLQNIMNLTCKKISPRVMEAFRERALNLGS